MLFSLFLYGWWCWCVEDSTICRLLNSSRAPTAQDYLFFLLFLLRTLLFHVLKVIHVFHTLDNSSFKFDASVNLQRTKKMFFPLLLNTAIKDVSGVISVRIMHSQVILVSMENLMDVHFLSCLFAAIRTMGH